MRKALIIDDDSVYRLYLGRLLEKIDFVFEEAEDGYEGILKIKRNPYDLVLLDLMMPQVDGEHVVQIMKRLNNDTPIIVISAHLNKERILKLAQNGVRGFLPKPMKVQNFYKTIKKVCTLNN